MPDSSTKEARVKMRRAGLPDAPPSAFNKALFVAVNHEAILELGYVDVREAFDFVHSMQAGETPEEIPEVSFYVVARLAVSPQGAVELQRVANGLVGHFQRHGHLPADLSELEEPGLQNAEVRLGGKEPPDGTPTS